MFGPPRPDPGSATGEIDQIIGWNLSWGHIEQRAWSLVRRGLLANVSAGVSVTTECLSGGKWLLYTTALSRLCWEKFNTFSCFA